MEQVITIQMPAIPAGTVSIEFDVQRLFDDGHGFDNAIYHIRRQLPGYQAGRGGNDPQWFALLQAAVPECEDAVRYRQLFDEAKGIRDSCTYLPKYYECPRLHPEQGDVERLNGILREMRALRIKNFLHSSPFAAEEEVELVAEDKARCR